MNKVLVVVDMQNDFIDQALGSKEAQMIVDHVAYKIATFSGTIFVTLDTHFDNYLETQEGQNLPVPHCIKDSEGWQLNSKIKQALSNKKYEVVEKHTFGSCELPQLIGKIKDLESIEIVGLCSDICVVSNAMLLKAHFPEIKISVDSKGCAGVSVESHEAALLTMKMCQIEIK